MNILQRTIATRSIARGFVLAIALLAAPAWAGTPWTLEWWTLDGGGEVFTSGGGWELSGTLGQWDSTSHSQSSGGAWEVTGGFWAISVTGSDHLFRDDFE